MTISISAQQISGVQIKEARKLLGWTQQKLASMADLSLLTVKRLEAEKAGNESIAKTVHVLRSSGIDFSLKNGVACVKLTRNVFATPNRTVAAEANREPADAKPKRRRRRLKQFDLGDNARQKLRWEARSILAKVHRCYKDGKIDAESAERMNNCVHRVLAVAEILSNEILSKEEKLAGPQEQLFLADLDELRSADTNLNRVLRHMPRQLRRENG